MGKHYTDYERYEHCRKYKISGMNVSEYARVNNLNRNTFKDLVAAYNNINGKFINVSTVSDNDGELIDNGAYRANILRDNIINLRQIRKNYNIIKNKNKVLNYYFNRLNNLVFLFV